MDAVLLAAGLGKRLRPHTLTTPKPLLPVQGRPILDWTIAALPTAVDRLIVVVHYLAYQIEEFLAQQKRFSNYAVVHQGDPRGTGDALRRCREKIRSGRFLVLNGDDLFGARDLHNLAQQDAGLLAYPVDEPRKFGIVFLNADGSLRELREKPDLEGRHPANTGAYMFPSEVFEIEIGLSQRGEYEITDFVIQLARRDSFQVVEAEYWFPIGDEDAWKRAQSEPLTKLLAPAIK